MSAPLSPGPSVTVARGSQQHRCWICPKRFERADYLKRHIASHENSRLHACDKCERRFNRRDLLTRHLANHEAPSAPKAMAGSNSSRAPGRAIQACDSCVQSKAKCGNTRPCRRCELRGTACVMSPSRRTARRGVTAASSPVDHPPTPSSNETTTDQDAQADAVITVAPQILYQNMPDSHFLPGVVTDGQDPITLGEEVAAAATTTLTPPSIQEQSDQGPSSVAQHDTSMLLMSPIPELGTNGVNSSHLGFGMGEPSSSTMTIGWDMLDLPSDVFQLSQDAEFEFGDGALRDHYSPINHPATSSQPQRFLSDERAIHEDDPESGSNPQGLLYGGGSKASNARARGYEAFKKSPWLWTPVMQDHAYAEGSQLSVDEPRIMASPQVLALVLRFSLSSLRIQCFPSCQLLDVLVQAFFVRERGYDSDPWIHEPTFSTAAAAVSSDDKSTVEGRKQSAGGCRTELLAGIVAAGATLFAVPGVWKMGLALQEICKLSTAAAVDEDNRLVRDLQSVQAFFLWTKIGLWSGFRRKMEIAEGFGHVVPTMLRRSGAFSHQRYTQRWRPTQADSGETLRQKWLRFLEEESYKRLVFQVFINEIRGSIAFTRAPALTGTELTLPVPASRELWDARTAEEWRDRFLSKSAKNQQGSVERRFSVTFVDAMKDPSVLQDETIALFTDLTLASRAILYGLWAQVAGFSDSRALFCPGKAAKTAVSGPPLWLEAQRQELYQHIQSVTMTLNWVLSACGPLSTASTLSSLPPETTLLSEFLAMSLHVSFDDVQRSAGRYGDSENDDSDSQPQGRVREWNKTRDRRFAIWHAGQVLRAALSLSPTRLEGFHAVVVYQACLVLWVSATVSQADKDTVDQLIKRHRVPNIVLDGCETEESRMYLTVGLGRPCIKVGNQLLGVDDGHDDEVRGYEQAGRPLDMSIVLRDVFHQCFPASAHSHQPLPPFLENLASLMADLVRGGGNV